MSAPAFTPGPWLLDNDGNVCWGPYGEDRIAEPMGSTHEEAEANGHLIAAAPTLFNAASLALDYILYRVGNDAAETVAVADLRSALAKARGEQ